MRYWIPSFDGMMRFGAFFTFSDRILRGNDKDETDCYYAHFRNLFFYLHVNQETEPSRIVQHKQHLLAFPVEPVEGTACLRRPEDYYLRSGAFILIVYERRA